MLEKLLSHPKVFAPLFALFITGIISVVFITIAGANPGQVFFYMLVGPFTSRLGLLEILAKTTPLILTGLAVVVAFNAGYYNIGGEGQLYAGALVATLAGFVLGQLPPLLLIPSLICLGFIGGAAWSAVNAGLKKIGWDEVVTTIMTNIIMILLVTALLNDFLQDPTSHSAQSLSIPVNAFYPLLAERSRVHMGLIVALVSTALVALLLNKLTLGFEIRTVGKNPSAARCAGINVNLTVLLAALLSGGLAGIAGVGEVLGVHHRLISTLSPGYGFTGIVVAKLSGLNPWITILSAVFLAILDVGSQVTNLETGVPIQLAGIIKWTFLLSLLAGQPTFNKLRRSLR